MPENSSHKLVDGPNNHVPIFAQICKRAPTRYFDGTRCRQEPGILTVPILFVVAKGNGRIGQRAVFLMTVDVNTNQSKFGEGYLANPL